MEEGEDLTSPGRHSYAVQTKGQEASHKKQHELPKRRKKKDEEVLLDPGGFCTFTAVHLRTVFVPSSIYCVCDNLNGRCLMCSLLFGMD